MFQRPPNIFPWLVVVTLSVSIFAAVTPRPRIITASPATTELLFQLGHGDSIVATSSFSDYPEQAKALPKMGALFMSSIEQTLRHNPEWVVLDQFTLNSSFEASLNTLFIKSIRVKIDTVTALFSESKKILETIYSETGEKTLAPYQAILDRHSARAHTHFSFLGIVWMSPAILFGSKNFLTDLFSQLGGKNLMDSEVQIPYPQVSEEWLMRHRPDILFFLEDFPEMKLQVSTQAEKWWPAKTPKIIGLPAKYFARNSFTPLEHLGEIASQVSP